MQKQITLASVASMAMGTFAVLVASADGATVQFQDGLSNTYVTNYDGTSDTEFDSAADGAGGFQNGNGGGAYYMRSNQTRTWEENRALVRFDLSSLNGLATVNSATLRLSELTGGAVPADDIPFNVYQITAANVGWVQGTNGSIVSPAADGEATWNHKVKSTVNWAGSPGLSTAGTDYVSTPVASGTYIPGDPDGTVLSLTLPASLIQSWIDNPSANAGLLILTDNDPSITYTRFATFATSEHENPAFRPMLQLDVTAVPEPSGLAALAGGLLLLARRRQRQANHGAI